MPHASEESGGLRRRNFRRNRLVISVGIAETRKTFDEKNQEPGQVEMDSRQDRGDGIIRFKTQARLEHLHIYTPG
jgi:hypothetical protein